jgi:hypothetical protein
VVLKGTARWALTAGRREAGGDRLANGDHRRRRVLPGGGDGGGQVISGGRGTQLAAEATALVDPRATTRVDMAITHRGIVRVAMGADPM